MNSNLSNRGLGVSGGIGFGVSFIEPQKIIDKLELKEGMMVADFGCGTGYFSFPLSKKVGDSGRVYAFDILKEKLETVESQAKLLGLNNIITKRANLELFGGSKLDRESMDWVFLVNMLFQNENKDAIIQEAKRVLKTGGKILIVEWNKEDSSFGPERRLKISKEAVDEIAGKNDLAVVDETEVGDFHFGVILSKQR